MKYLRLYICSSVTYCLLFILTASLLSMTGNAHAIELEEDEYEDYYSLNHYRVLYDPLEPINRQIFYFNIYMDKVLLQPVAGWYNHHVSKGSKIAIDNLLNNMYLPVSMVNNVLQEKPHNALMDFWRFTINTILGMGVCDIVKKVNGYSAPNQTLGNTLAYYGIGPGMYVVLPLMGSTNLRDISDILLDDYLNPLWYYTSYNKALKLSKHTLEAISKRAQMLEFGGGMEKQPGDLYYIIRSMYHQHRESIVNYPPKKYKK